MLRFKYTFKAPLKELFPDWKGTKVTIYLSKNEEDIFIVQLSIYIDSVILSLDPDQ